MELLTSVQMRVLTFLLGMVLFACMSGCMQTQPDLLGLREAGTIKDFSLTVLSYELLEEVQTSEILSYQPTGEGNRYLKVKMTVKNIGESSLTLLPLEYLSQTDLTLSVGMTQTATSDELPPADDPSIQHFESVNLMGYQEGLADKLLAPQEEITGYVFFEVPAAIKDAGTRFWLEASLGRSTLRFALGDAAATS